SNSRRSRAFPSWKLSSGKREIQVLPTASRSGSDKKSARVSGDNRADRNLKALRESLWKFGFNLAGNEIAVWVGLQLGHPHDPNVPVKHLSLRARLGNVMGGTVFCAADFSYRLSIECHINRTASVVMVKQWACQLMASGENERPICLGFPRFPADL